MRTISVGLQRISLSQHERKSDRRSSYAPHCVVCHALVQVETEVLNQSGGYESQLKVCQCFTDAHADPNACENVSRNAKTSKRADIVLNGK